MAAISCMRSERFGFWQNKVCLYPSFCGRRISMAPQSNGGGEKNEFDDLISALRTGDVFGENMDKFRRNRFVFQIVKPSED